jgi:hypothetical protein
MRAGALHTGAAALQLNRYKFSAVARCRRNGPAARSGTSP